jgi:hypothetical protein
MGRFVGRSLLFTLPFWLYALVIFMVDPFGYLHSSSLISEDTKLRTAARLNPCFWKMNQFRRKPSAYILLGDSRMAALNPTQVERAAGEDYFNFAYGGASLEEMIDTFWFATSQVALRKVFIGLNLNVYNDYNYTWRTKLFETVQRNPALYFVNRTVLQAAVYGAYSEATGADPKIGVPTLDRDGFWQEPLRTTASYYKNYVYPTKYKQQLMRVAQYCREHNVQLSFVIFPTYVEVQHLITDYHLQRANAMFRQDLASMATTYDYDYENEITTHKENYTDPIHTNGQICNMIILEIWQGGLRYGRQYSAPPRL